MTHQGRASGQSPAARVVAFRILLRVETDAAYAGFLLRGLPAEMSRRDRALVTELVLGTLRWRARIDHALAQFSRRSLDQVDPPLLTTLRLAAHQILHLDRIPAPAAVDESVGLARRWEGRSGAGFVNGVLRALCRGPVAWPGPDAGPVDRLAIQGSHPAWMVQRWIDRLGERDTEALLEANNRPAQTHLRVNRRRGSVDGLVERLAVEGMTAEPGRWVPGSLRVSSGSPTSGPSFDEGLFYVQDEASMLVAELLGVAAGDRVVDLCSAPGGKTTDLAERLGADGLLVAADRSRRRLDQVREHCTRLGLDGVRRLLQDTTAPALEAATMHRVLLDAPCTGTGILRRRPEIRWRRGPEDPARMARLQRSMLEAAAPLVRPGGTLVYSVCSLEEEEGPGVVAAFLERRSDFRAEDPSARVPPELVSHTGGLPHLTTWPHRHDVDGFFAVLLRRE